jgi:hypothetical protein
MRPLGVEGEEPGRVQPGVRPARTPYSEPLRVARPGVPVGPAVALVAAAAALGGLGTAAVADATHKGTHDLWHHGLGDCCDNDGFLHPYMSEVNRTSRESFVAWGGCCGNPDGYYHFPEQRDDDWHNDRDGMPAFQERYYFASVRAPVTNLAHQHHVCGDGDCVGAAASDKYE